MADTTSWDDIKASGRSPTRAVPPNEDQARISPFRAMVYRLRVEAGLTQAELADRMGPRSPR
jgi:hypothetical protein